MCNYDIVDQDILSEDCIKVLLPGHATMLMNKDLIKRSKRDTEDKKGGGSDEQEGYSSVPEDWPKRTYEDISK